MVSCSFAGLSWVLSVSSFQDQSQRSSYSHGRRQKLKARGWGCWSGGMKGHLSPLLYVTYVTLTFCWPKQDTWLKPQSLIGEMSSQGRCYKVTWKRAWLYSIVYHNANCIPLASKQFRFAKCCSSGQMRLEGKFSGSPEKDKDMCAWGKHCALGAYEVPWCFEVQHVLLW